MLNACVTANDVVEPLPVIVFPLAKLNEPVSTFLQVPQEVVAPFLT